MVSVETRGGSTRPKTHIARQKDVLRVVPKRKSQTAGVGEDRVTADAFPNCRARERSHSPKKASNQEMLPRQGKEVFSGTILGREKRKKRGSLRSFRASDAWKECLRAVGEDPRKQACQTPHAVAQILAHENIQRNGRPESCKELGKEKKVWREVRGHGSPGGK